MSRRDLDGYCSLPIRLSYLFGNDKHIIGNFNHTGIEFFSEEKGLVIVSNFADIAQDTVAHAVGDGFLNDFGLEQLGELGGGKKSIPHRANTPLLERRGPVTEQKV